MWGGHIFEENITTLENTPSPRFEEIVHGRKLWYYNTAPNTLVNFRFPISYHLYTTAPPRNISLTALTPTTLLLRWEPPEEDPGDGTILQYLIACRFGDGDSLPACNSSASSQSLQLTDLHPFTNYNCCVSAQRTNGNSPESCSSETTPEDGEN